MDEQRGMLTPAQLKQARTIDPTEGPVVEAGRREKDDIIRDSRHIAYVCAGGQTGVDRGGLDAARAVGVPIRGWVPAHGLAEDMPEPPGLLARYPELHETPSPWFMQRTAWNVRDSHCTLIVSPGGIESGSGTEATAEFAHDYVRPLLVVEGPEDLERIWIWLEGIGQGLTLNVAGPRASKNPDAYALSYELMSLLLKRDAAQ